MTGAGYRPIKPSEVGRLGIDDSDNLYWDERLIHTSTQIELTKGQTLFAKIAAVIAILGSLATIANATASWLNYLARVKSANVQPIPNGQSPNSNAVQKRNGSANNP